MTAAMNQIPKGYKQTEIGVIPEDWDVKRIGDIADVVGGGTPSTRIIRYWNGSINWFTPTEIGTRKFVYQSDRKITNDGLRNSSAKILEEGTVLLTSRAGIGDLAILKEKASTNQGFQSLVPKDQTNSEFLYYLMLTKKADLLDKASGSTFLEISPNNVRAILVQYPQNDEQAVIATALSDADVLIEKLEKLIEKKKNIKQGAMQALLTGKRRLPGFSGKWEIKKLNEIFSISAGGDLVKESHSSIEDDAHPFPIYSNSLEAKGLYGYTKVPRHKANCITITARGTIGRANARDHEFDAIGRLLILEPIRELDCFFISEYLNNRVAFSIESTGVPQLTAPQASKYLVVYPTPKEQTAIAKVLSDMDSEIETLESELSKYKNIKQGMMQKLLTGQIRLIKK